MISLKDIKPWTTSDTLRKTGMLVPTPKGWRLLREDENGNRYFEDEVKK